jgi:thiamine pyrophosphate-dependent acetolactate synthase large subunit-like protein
VLAREVVAALARIREDAVVVTGPGGLSGALFGASDQPATIYNMEFGYAAATCLGIAMAVPDRRVVAIEGDGSSIAGSSSFATIARYRPPNLVVIVADNGLYGTGAATVETATSHGADIAAIARACGLPAEAVLTPDTLADVERDLGRVMTEPGPWVIVARVELDAAAAAATRPRPGLDFVEASIRFQSVFPRRTRAS